jgi:hypothetical protein
MSGATDWDLQPQVSALMSDFCRKVNKTVVVKDGAFDGGVGLRVLFSRETPSAPK